MDEFFLDEDEVDGGGGGGGPRAPPAPPAAAAAAGVRAVRSDDDDEGATARRPWTHEVRGREGGGGHGLLLFVCWFVFAGGGHRARGARATFDVGPQRRPSGPSARRAQEGFTPGGGRARARGLGCSAAHILLVDAGRGGLKPRDGGRELILSEGWEKKKKNLLLS
jgi:hypothetical protein